MAPAQAGKRAASGTFFFWASSGQLESIFLRGGSDAPGCLRREMRLAHCQVGGGAVSRELMIFLRSRLPRLRCCELGRHGDWHARVVGRR